MCVCAHSQEKIKWNRQLNSKDLCTSDNILSTKLFKSGDQLADPVINLNSDETVTLIFDELLLDYKGEGDYYYTIVHCDADWMEETLVMSQYMTGFSENNLNSVKHSRNTMIAYKTYTLVLPNPDVKLKISGNYLIRIFDRHSAVHKPVLVKGFSVVESLVPLSTSFMPTLIPPCDQQLDIKVYHSELKITDVHSNLKMRIEQNSTKIPGMKTPVATFIYPDYVDYSHTTLTRFPGRNEFRAFDTRSLLYNGQGVENRYMNDRTFVVSLVRDTERLSYSPVNDINGKYMVASEYSIDHDIQSDYVEVIFSFAPKNLTEGRIFLYGELTNWTISEKYELLPDNADNLYQCKTLLKQGFYNYQYVVVRQDNTIDLTATEGCFFDTENVYNVYLYYYSPENKADHLVGFQQISRK
jgi:hypothetical protein